MSDLLTAELVVLSDLHLLEPRDERTKRFLALIAELEKGRLKHLVLVGDIFEFLLGSSRYFQRKFANVGDSLARLSSKGVQIHYLEGNHEFDISHLDWPGVKFIQDRDFLLKWDGLKLQFTHGDLVYSPVAYRRFRKVVKSRWFLALCRLIPGRFLDWLALRGAAASRAQDQYRTMDHGAIFKAMAQWLGSDADFGLFGHFHVPFCDKLRNGAELWSMDSWDRPSVLIFYNRQFYRLSYEEQKLLPTRLEKNRPIMGMASLESVPSQQS